MGEVLSEDAAGMLVKKNGISNGGAESDMTEADTDHNKVPLSSLILKF